MAKVTIDGITIEVADGTTILNAARAIGKEVAPPTMCYYSKLKTSGGYCRTCLVEVSKGSEKDPRPMPKLVASCRTTVMDGMEVWWNSYWPTTHSTAQFVIRQANAICKI
jgi:NADH-quinone oxidoreductase subunit G